jgi:hypothetical protein
MIKAMRLSITPLKRLEQAQETHKLNKSTVQWTLMLNKVLKIRMGGQPRRYGRIRGANPNGTLKKLATPMAAYGGYQPKM